MSKTVDELYEQYVKKAGLFGKAFYGHKRTRRETRKLRYLHFLAVREVEKREQFLASLGKEQTDG
jgi:hypothetical protein